MIKLAAAAFLFSLHTLLLALFPAQVAFAQTGSQAGDTHIETVEWTSRGVQHVYGLPDAKPKDKGTLALSPAGLSFSGKSSRSMIPRQSVFAVSAGDQRVELWGIKGQILRAAIPNGGGVAAAMFMHHRVDMLTVEFADAKGGYHAAVFFLPAKEATRALESFTKTPIIPREPQSNACQSTDMWPSSILLSAPNWTQTEVPAAYRALVYERLYDSLRQVQGVRRVYRDGESSTQQGCPQYTMQLSISGFKQGSQVKRAVMGPVGFFVGTTQMKFDATVTDASGRVVMQEQITATTRGETESTNVAASVAKKLAKQYSAMMRRTADTGRAVTTPAAKEPLMKSLF